MTRTESRRLLAATSLEEVARIVGGTAPKRRPAKRFDVGRMKPTKADLNDRTAAVRAEVVKRADGHCEMCGNMDDPRYPLEMHHLLAGRGRRRWDQAASNCLMVCPFCHDVCGGRILYAEGFLRSWARKYGYADTLKIIERRVDKALLADPFWPRNEDQTRRLGPDSTPKGAP
jgi:hypothetical protein